MDVTSLFQYTFEFFAIFSIAAIAGMVSERAGIVNVAIEGFMTMGAFLMTTLGYLGNQGLSSSNLLQILWLLVILGIGALMSFMHSYVVIRWKCDQIISGTAINLFMQGFGLFIVTSGAITGDPTVINGYFTSITLDSTKLLSIYLIIAITITLITGFYFSLTRTGNRHASAGENPNALDAVGISVIKYRYVAVAVSGALAALAGAIFIILIKNTQFYGSVDGFGFISLALMIIGQWRIKFIIPFAFLFSFLFAFVRIAGFSQGIPNIIRENALLLKALPFIASLVAMVSISKFSKPPASAGVPFDKSKR